MRAYITSVCYRFRGANACSRAALPLAVFHAARYLSVAQ